MDKINLRALLLGALLSVIIFLMLASFFMRYQSTVTILITAKSEVAARNLDKIVGNISRLPSTLSFYDRLLENNPDVRDVAAGDSQLERKQVWNGMLNVRQGRKNNSIIKISLRATNKNDAEQLATKTARTLFDSASLYYNVKSDVDMRLIDGPITKNVVIGWEWLLAVSVLLGSVLAFLGRDAIVSIDMFADEKALKIKERAKSFFQTDKILTGKADSSAQEQADASLREPIVENLYPAEEIAAPEQELEAKELETLNRIIQQDVYPNFPEMPVHAQHKASAPDNLPIADSSFLAQQYPEAENMEQEESQKPESEKEQVSHEPTPEELKKRLNELLRGKI